MLYQSNFSFHIFCDQVPILRLSGQHPSNLSCLYFGSAGSHTSKPSLVKTKTLLRQIVCGRARLRVEFRILRFSSKWTIHRNILSPENWVFLLDTIGAATDGSKPLQINKIWKCWIKESYWIITKNIKQIIKSISQNMRTHCFLATQMRGQQQLTTSYMHRFQIEPAKLANLYVCPCTQMDFLIVVQFLTTLTKHICVFYFRSYFKVSFLPVFSEMKY